MANEHLPTDLIERLRARANDPERRSDSSSIRGQTMSIDSLFDRLGPKGEQLRSIQSQLQGLMGGLGRMRVATPMATPMPDESEPLPLPASGDQIAAVEQAIGRPFPPGLRQLYSEIADGGFGPGGGLFSLARMIDAYEEMTSEPAGPQNQPWPANLLPMVDAEPGYDCLDLESGEVIAWDPEEIEGYSNAAWLRSFKSAAPSLGEWLKNWLERPTVGERMRQQADELMRDPIEIHIKNMIESYGRMSAAERAQHGLPETGWEDAVRKRFGR